MTDGLTIDDLIINQIKIVNTKQEQIVARGGTAKDVEFLSSYTGVLVDLLHLRAFASKELEPDGSARTTETISAANH